MSEFEEFNRRPKLLRGCASNPMPDDWFERRAGGISRFLQPMLVILSARRGRAWNTTCASQQESEMAEKKIVFIAFAIEDERQRDLFKGQSLHPRTPFEFIDMSVKEPYDKEWKERVRTRIRRSHGVIALVSKSSLTSDGQKWEIGCAKEEKKPLLGI
jgi:hypothetical protein